MRYLFGVLSVALLLTAESRADVSIRYKTEMQAALPIPQGASPGMDSSVAVKGRKVRWTAANSIMIADLDKQQLTVIDPVGRRYATIPIAEYQSKVNGLMANELTAATAGLPPEITSLMASMKTNVNSRNTGQTQVVQGIQSEEHEVTISIEIPMPPGLPPSAGMQTRLVMSLWTAQPNELVKIPELRELAAVDALRQNEMNPAAMFQTIMPAMGESMAKVFKEVYKDGAVMLKSHMSVYTPGMDILAQATGQPAFQPNAPFMELTQVVDELSTKEVDPALFEIPKDYTSFERQLNKRVLTFSSRKAVGSLKITDPDSPESRRRVRCRQAFGVPR
jgi:hypothetical protein